MCGILGLYTNQSPAEFEERVNSSLHSILHRGPDEQALEHYLVADATLVFGHTRLSIIDLSPGGKQPKHSDDGRYTMIFNGEIYNYRELRQELQSLGCIFQTNSDSEVLLACWKVWSERSLNKLCGMFALSILDRQDQTLTCVRDAFGIKPLFYRLDAQSFMFASEITALLKLSPVRPKLNYQKAYDYLANDSYDDSPETFLTGVYHLPPGHLLKLDLAKLSKALKEGKTCSDSVVSLPWWQPKIAERTDLSFKQATEQMREMFLTNVRLHLRSDVPLGAALSGGIDSSAVVCAIRKQEPDLPIQTFSYVAKGPSVDEEKWIDLVNSQVGAIPHKVFVVPEDLVGDIDDLILAQGEPFGGTSIYAQYRVFKLAKEHGVIVTLDGQGADELLAGYHGYPEARMRSLIERGEMRELIRFVEGWSQWPGRSLPVGIRSAIKQVMPKNSVRTLQRMKKGSSFAWLDTNALHDMRVNMHSGVDSEDVISNGRRLADALRAALKGKGLAALLRHGDRNSMRWSIESRVPFLTQDMAEFVLTLPEHYLVSAQGETKHIFRAAMRGIVPDVILNRKDKIGFATPEQDLLEMLGGKVMTWIDSAEKIQFLRPNVMRDVLQKVVNGDLPFQLQYWRLLNFCRWLSLIDVAN